MMRGHTFDMNNTVLTRVLLSYECCVQEEMLHGDGITREEMIKHKQKRKVKKKKKRTDYKSEPTQTHANCIIHMFILCSIIFHYPQRIHLFLCVETKWKMLLN